MMSLPEAYLLTPLSHSQPQRKESNAVLFPSATHKMKQIKAFLSSHTLLFLLSCFNWCPLINPNRMAQLSLVVSLPLGVFMVSYPVILIYSGHIYPVTLVEWLRPPTCIPHLHLKSWSFCSLWVALEAGILPSVASCPHTYPEWGCGNIVHKREYPSLASALRQALCKQDNETLCPQWTFNVTQVELNWVRASDWKIKNQGPTVPGLGRFRALLWVIFV